LSVPGFEDEAAGAVFAVFGEFVFLEAREGDCGVVGSVRGGGVEDVFEFLSAVTSKCTTCGHFKVHHL
jgi:hypothetical protein